QPRRDLLQQPSIAVRVVELGVRAVGGVIGRGPAETAVRAVDLKLRACRFVVEHLGDRGTAGGEFVSCSLDVRDDQVEALSRAGGSRRHLRAELDRRRGARWRELDDSEAVVEGEVGIEPPTEVPIELLRTVDIRYRDDDGLELQVSSLDARD